MKILFPFNRFIIAIGLLFALYPSGIWAKPLYQNYFLAGYYRVFPDLLVRPFVKSVQFGFSLDMGGNIKGVLNVSDYASYHPSTGYPKRRYEAKGRFLGPVRGNGRSATARILIRFKDGSRIRGTLSAKLPSPDILRRYYTNCKFRGSFSTPRFRPLRLRLSAIGQFVSTGSSWYLDSNPNWNPNVGF